jgi:hypothetical protein
VTRGLREGATHGECWPTGSERRSEAEAECNGAATAEGTRSDQSPRTETGLAVPPYFKDSPISAVDSADLSCSPFGLLSQGRSQPRGSRFRRVPLTHALRTAILRAILFLAAARKSPFPPVWILPLAQGGCASCVLRFAAVLSSRRSPVTPSRTPVPAPLYYPPCGPSLTPATHRTSAHSLTRPDDLRAPGGFQKYAPSQGISHFASGSAPMSTSARSVTSLRASIASSFPASSFRGSVFAPRIGRVTRPSRSA